MAKFDQIIVVVGGPMATISVAEQLAHDVSRTAPLTPPLTPGIVLEVQRSEFDFKAFEAGIPRERPKRDWEQRAAPKHRRRR